jgi:hypothetical protein
MESFPPFRAVGGARVIRSVSLGLCALALWAIGTTNATAQSPMIPCPGAGLVVTAQNNRGSYTITHLGPDKSDPAVCRSKAEGQGSLAPGKEVRRIFTWYDIDLYPTSSADQKKIEESVGAVLSGRINETAFDAVMGKAGTSWSWNQNETWKRVGQDTIDIGSQNVNTVHLRQETKPGGGTNYHVAWDLWYDPVRHLFLKGHATVYSGNQTITEFQVTEISAQ